MIARTAGFALAMLTFLAVGLSTGSEIYYLFFFTMLAMLVWGAASALWTAYTVKVDVTGVKKRARRGERAPIIITARHACPLLTADVRIELEMPDKSEVITAFLIPCKKREFRFVMRCPHRGVYEAGVGKIVVSDVFGLIRVSRRGGLARASVEVTPNIRRVEAMELRAGDTGLESRSRATEDASSPSDVRAWRDGDVLKKVHWKLTMRKRELMVKTYEESARPDTIILPDLTPINATREQALTIEDCVCEVSLGALTAQLRSDAPVIMPVNSSKPCELSARYPSEEGRFFTELARVPFDSPYPYEQALSTVTARLQRTGGVIIVTPRLTMRIADVAIRLRQMGLNVAAYWITDSTEDAALGITSRLSVAGIKTRLIDPWAREGGK